MCPKFSWYKVSQGSPDCSPLFTPVATLLTQYCSFSLISYIWCSRAYLLIFWEITKFLFPCLLKLLVRMQVKTELIFKVVFPVKVFIYFRSTWWYNCRRLLKYLFLQSEEKLDVEKTDTLCSLKFWKSVVTGYFFLLSSENKHPVFYIILQPFAIIFLNASENEVFGTLQISI